MLVSEIQKSGEGESTPLGHQAYYLTTFVLIRRINFMRNKIFENTQKNILVHFQEAVLGSRIKSEDVGQKIKVVSLVPSCSIFLLIYIRLHYTL